MNRFTKKKTITNKTKLYVKIGSILSVRLVIFLFFFIPVVSLLIQTYFLLDFLAYFLKKLKEHKNDIGMFYLHVFC